MCGIAGFISVISENSAIQRMTDQLLHRGPDASGVASSPSNRVQLGHTRLCVIDLSESANQPFYSSDRRHAIVFNGEIYNFKSIKERLTKEHHLTFRSSSDTEVLLEGYKVWGPKVVEYAEGMFAFAIADLEADTLFLARDRLGKKPLYYLTHKSGFYFASEIKALLEVPDIDRTISDTSVSLFLHLGYIPGPRTIYEHIKKFPSGHWATITTTIDITFKSYWNVRSHWNTPPKESGNEVNALHATIRESVARRLVADVPIGSFLSGGTDSSLVSAIAQEQLLTKLKTFSIGFKEAKHDERIFAERVATTLKTDHTAYQLSETDALGLLDQFLDHFDEPFADSSAIPTMLVSKLAREDVTVALTGDGGDELFQGYGSYQWAERLSNPILQMFRTPLSYVFQTFGNNRLKRGALVLEKTRYGSHRSHIFSQEQYLFSQHELKDQLLINMGSPFNYDDPIFLHRRSEGELQSLFDLQYYLKDDLLVKVDMASMYYALECRCPLLDSAVVAFALNLSSRLKIRGSESKWILKQILRKYLPDDLVFRPKWGFSIPLSKWLKNDLRFFLEQYLAKEVVEAVGLVKYSYVAILKEKFLSGDDFLYNRLWALAVLHRWMIKHRQ
jgi:asparagine synthase (glutamine-hydrolysing)